MRSCYAQGACKLRIRRLHRQSICLRGGRILPNLVLWPCSGLSASPFASQAVTCLSREATTLTKMAKRGTPADFQAAMPVRPLPRPARRARAVSAAIDRCDHPPSTEARSNRPLQLVPLLRTTRWRLMEVIPRYVYQPHQPHQPGSYRRSSLPPDSVHRCARHARTHAQLSSRLRCGAGCRDCLCRTNRALHVGRAAAHGAGLAVVCQPLCPPHPVRTCTLGRPSTRLRGCRPAMSQWIRIPALRSSSNM
jgi:hypothetical protein